MVVSSAMTDALTEWVSVGEAAAIIGVSPSTIRRYEHDGLLPCYRTPTNQRRYRREDVEHLLSPPVLVTPTEAAS